MDYRRITDIAFRSAVIQQQIMEYYRLLGANSQYDQSVKESIYAVIRDLEKNLSGLDARLKKEIQ